MTFPDYAARETTDLIERLMARRSEDLATHLRTVRDALDTAVRTIETPPTPDPAVADLIQRLGEAYDEATGRLREEARVTLAAAHEDLEATRTDLRSTRADLEAARADRDASRADVEATRQALDEERESAAALVATLTELRNEHAAAQTSTHLANQIKAGLEEELRDARALLAQAESRADELNARVDTVLAESTSLRERVRAAEEKREQLASAYAAAESRASAEAQARMAAERDVQDLRASLDGALADLELFGSKLEAAAGERGRLSHGLSTAESALQTAEAQQQNLAAQLRAQTAKIQALERNHARQEETIAQLQARLDAAPRTADAASAPAAPDAAPPVSLAAGDLPGILPLLEASLRSVDAFGTAETIPDLMGALLAQLSAHFSRVALFTVKGNRLAGEHQVGFDHTTYVRKMVIPMGVDSMLTRVAASGVLEWYTGEDLSDESKGAPFRGSPAVAVVLPIRVRDEIVGVVYGDDGAQGHGAQDPAVYQVRVRLASLLVRQAALSLMRLTHELRALAELRQYATTLIEGTEQMYAADVESRRTPEDARRRLEDNLECARQIFAQRASLDGLSAATVLDEQIAALVQSRHDDQFARELAGIVGIPYAAPPQSAEAS